jgi:N-acetylglucosaminyl-diphospho-decaprenol L-rhamnosyltransferase
MLLTVVVVTYNSAIAIEQTLASVTDAVSHLDAEIFVIDNASSDGSASVAERILGEQGTVVRMSEDLGYGTGINVGARRARGRYLLMMNDDVIVTSASIDRLISTLQEHPTVAMVGPLLCHPDGSPTYTMYRWSPGWRDELAKARDRLMGTSVRTTVPDGDVVEVEVLFCACALIDTGFFRSIGGFNEVFFVYGEDLDLSRRITSVGLNVAVDTRAVAIHHQDEDLARRPKGRGFFERVVDANDTYYRIWLSRPSRVLLHLWHMIGRNDQPYRAVYHLNHAIRRGTALRRQRWPDPLVPIENPDQTGSP